MMAELGVYTGLFWNAFIAATVLPAFSEIALAALLQSGHGHPFGLFIAATMGNVAGSIVNWWIGARLVQFQDKRWFPFSKKQIVKASAHFSKYGKWSLLFAWLPIVGDPLTLVAGALRIKFPTFLMFVTLGKAIRYGIIILMFYP